MNLGTYSLQELKALEKRVVKAIEKKEAAQLKDARKAMEKLAKEHGVVLTDILGGEAKPKRKKRKPAAKAKPKFKNPNDPNQTWSGRGRQPGWYKDAKAAGKSDKALEV